MPDRSHLPKRFSHVYAFWWIQWATMQVYVLHHFGISWPVSIADSLLSNGLTGGLVIASNNIMRFYQPYSKHRYLGLIWNICLAFISIFVFNEIQLHLMSAQPAYLELLHHSLLIRFCFALLLITCSTMMSWLWNQLNELKASDSRQAEIEKLAKDTELIGIRQQLQPHFLFNSLNSISALTGSKPEQARKMIQQLSDFLRGTLRKDDQQRVTLQEELKHLGLYLEIEKVRFGHRLDVHIETEESCNQMMIPALLLQPVVENAIKFGLYDTLGQTTIRIRSRAEEGNLIIETDNPYDQGHAQPRRGTGFGLSSIERRLYLLYGRNDLLTTRTEENLFITSIKIPQA